MLFEVQANYRDTFANVRFMIIVKKRINTHADPCP